MLQVLIALFEELSAIDFNKVLFQKELDAPPDEHSSGPLEAIKHFVLASFILQEHASMSVLHLAMVTRCKAVLSSPQLQRQRSLMWRIVLPWDVAEYSARQWLDQEEKTASRRVKQLSLEKCSRAFVSALLRNILLIVKISLWPPLLKETEKTINQKKMEAFKNVLKRNPSPTVNGDASRDAQNSKAAANPQKEIVNFFVDGVRTSFAFKPFVTPRSTPTKSSQATRSPWKLEKNEAERKLLNAEKEFLKVRNWVAFEEMQVQQSEAPHVSPHPQHAHREV